MAVAWRIYYRIDYWKKGWGMTEKKRVEWLDQLRGTAMFFVVLGHISSISEDHLLLIYAFHMPLFFMISGATFHPGKYETFGACVLDKAKKLLVPYAWLYVINIAFWWVNHKTLGSSDTSIAELLIGMLVSNQELAPMTSGALWFLPVLFFVSVLIDGCTLFAKREDKKIPIEASMIFLLAAAVYLSMFYGKDTVLHWATVPMAAVFYYLGWVFMQNRNAIMLRLTGSHDATERSARYTFVAFILISVGVWAAFANGKISMHRNDYNDIALMFVAALCLSLALTMLMMKLPKVRLLDFAGKNSIIFFGFHIALIRFLENWPVTDGFVSEHALITATFVFVAMIPVSLFVNKFCPFIVAKKYPKRT